MSMMITFSDEAASRLRAEALTRGISVDDIASNLVVEHLPAANDPDRIRALLQTFIGSASSDNPPFEIHEGRSDLAARRLKNGTRFL
jgi:hypothetical protein